MAWPDHTLLFENSHNRIYHLPQHQTLMICPRGVMDTQAFVEANLALLRWGKELGATQIILNELALERMPPAARTWLMTNFLNQREVKVVLRQITDISVVRSPHVVAETLMRVLHRIAASLTGKSFYYYHSVEEWATAVSATSIAS